MEAPTVREGAPEHAGNTTSFVEATLILTVRSLPGSVAQRAPALKHLHRLLTQPCEKCRLGKDPKLEIAGGDLIDGYYKCCDPEGFDLIS